MSRLSSSLAGKHPRPISVFVTGIPVRSMNSLSSGAASRHPPPAYTTGFFALAIMSTTCCICGAVGGDGRRLR